MIINTVPSLQLGVNGLIANAIIDCRRFLLVVRDDNLGAFLRYLDLED